MSDEAVGLSIPDRHAAAFVAEVFEDVEQSTTWDGVVDKLVAAGQRDAWNELSRMEQVIEVLSMADRYDRRAVEQLEQIPLDEERTEATDDLFSEAIRYRRNADTLRDGIAAAYGDGYVDDDGLVDAVEEFDFETDEIARREQLLESVASVHEYDFRPYGGTLMSAEDDDGSPEFEAWD
jgi:hypothetical protein